jgi:hypothetical protein
MTIAEEMAMFAEDGAAPKAEPKLTEGLTELQQAAFRKIAAGNHKKLTANECESLFLTARRSKALDAANEAQTDADWRKDPGRQAFMEVIDVTWLSRKFLLDTIGHIRDQKIGEEKVVEEAVRADPYLEDDCYPDITKAKKRLRRALQHTLPRQPDQSNEATPITSPFLHRFRRPPSHREHQCNRRPSPPVTRSPPFWTSRFPRPAGCRSTIRPTSQRSRGRRNLTSSSSTPDDCDALTIA